MALTLRQQRHSFTNEHRALLLVISHTWRYYSTTSKPMALLQVVLRIWQWVGRSLPQATSQLFALKHQTN